MQSPGINKPFAQKKVLEIKGRRLGVDQSRLRGRVVAPSTEHPEPFSRYLISFLISTLLNFLIAGKCGEEGGGMQKEFM